MKIFIFILFMVQSSNASEEIAIKKIKEFGKVLKMELKAGLKKSPATAVEVCNLKAPQIQEQASTDAVVIGRVSLKNRNPNNKPKVWMRNYINQFHENKINKAYIITNLDNGKKGLLKPIKTMPLCLKCHGENIDENLYNVIKKKYPEDKAIGYKVGEIRGFFWVEY